MSGSAAAGAAAGAVPGAAPGAAAPGAAAPAAGAPGYTSLLGGEPAAGGAGGAGAADPRAWLPEAYRADPTFQDLRDVDQLAKSYKHASGMLGVDRAQLLRLPTKEDAPEWGQVWDRLGRPEKADGYDLTAPAGVDAQALADFKATAHQLGISKTQASKLMEFYGGSLTALQARSTEAATAAQSDVTNTLKREWGNTYDDQIHSARRAVREVGGADMLALLEQTRLGDHPAVIRMFAKLGAGRAEPSDLKGGGGQFGGGLTPAAAQAEIRQLQADSAFGKSLMNSAAPGYREARSRWDALHLAAYPKS